MAALAAALLAGAPAAAQPAGAVGDASLRVVYWPGDRPLAERTLRAARAPLPLPGIPDSFAPARTGTIYLAPTPAVWDSLTRRAPAWAAGVAIPGLRRIILPAFQSSRTPLGDPTGALRHELAHLALHAYLPAPIPRWFSEGYATWVSGGWGDDAAWQIRLALLTGRGPRLDSITLAWPARAGDARLAYLLSASAVQHLATRGSEEGFAALLAAWRREGSLDRALRSTYLMTPEQFEEEWQALVRRRYGWLLALSQMGVFWIALILLVMLLGWRRRQYNRERLERLAAEDRMLPPPRTDGVDVQYPLQ